MSDFGAMSALTEIKKRIQEAKKEEAELTELDLTSINIGKFTPEISALIEKEDKLEVIILVDCSLTTLAGFPKCGFQAIDLSQNSYISAKLVSQTTPTSRCWQLSPI